MASSGPSLVHTRINEQQFRFHLGEKRLVLFQMPVYPMNAVGQDVPHVHKLGSVMKRGQPSGKSWIQLMPDVRFWAPIVVCQHWVDRPSLVSISCCPLASMPSMGARKGLPWRITRLDANIGL